MKRCPACNRTYTDANLSFCIDDGTPLVMAESEASGSEGRETPRTEGRGAGDWTGPAYRPPSYVPSGSGEKRRAWPWVVGILGILFIGILGLGIAGVVLIPRWIETTDNNNRSAVNANVEIGQIDNANVTANVNATVPGTTETADSKNDDDPDDADPVSAPTDQAQVLAQLTELEQEWTVANINADKKALDRILADDYVGIVENGKPQGKAEYLRTIQRDTMIQSWDFEDLKVSLKGDRATLEGVLKLRIQNQELPYRFTDKFVWRDARWQAVSSEVAQSQ